MAEDTRAIKIHPTYVAHIQNWNVLAFTTLLYKPKARMIWSPGMYNVVHFASGWDMSIKYSLDHYVDRIFPGVFSNLIYVY